MPSREFRSREERCYGDGDRNERHFGNKNKDSKVRRNIRNMEIHAISTNSRRKEKMRTGDVATGSNSTMIHPYPNSPTNGTESPISYPFVRLRIPSAVENVKAFVKKMDATNIGLTMLISLAIFLMQHGTQQQRSDSSKLTRYSHPDATSLKFNNSTSYIRSHNEKRFEDSRANIDNIGFQARSQVPIPIEYSNFVELPEFSKAVAFMRLHAQKMVQPEQQQNQLRHPGRMLQESNSVHFNETVGNFEDEDDDEVSKMENAMDASWKQVLEQTDSQQLNQIYSVLPTVKHIPVFWHVPRSAGTTLTTLLGTCLGLIQATSSYSSTFVYKRWDDEAMAARFQDPTLYVFQMNGQRFVNVDLNNLHGVKRAVEGKLVSNKLADVVVVHDARMGSLLFDEVGDHATNLEEKLPLLDNNSGPFKGLLFSMFRHPIDRSISVFYNKQQVHDSVHFDPTLEIDSLTDWINGPSYVNDYMTRSLVGKLNERSPQTQFPLNRRDLDEAKEILRRKVLVGLTDEKAESMRRFEKFFGWNVESRRGSALRHDSGEFPQKAQPEKWRKEIVEDEECRDTLLHLNWVRKHKHPLPGENDVPSKLLESKNRYDIELYKYARQLFDEQYFQLGFDDDAVT